VSIPLLVFGLSLVAIISTAAGAERSESSKFTIRPCPNKPNCVSSRAPDGPRRMDPIRYKGSVEEAQQKLLDIIGTFPRTTVVQNVGNCLKVEFCSVIFSFVDDVDFEFDDAAKRIHFRSASRLGYYDFGVNRSRMETIIRQFSGK